MMSEIKIPFKQGFVLWKQTWFTQIRTMVVLLIVIGSVFMLIAFPIIILALSSINQDSESILAQLVVIFGVPLLFFVIALIGPIIIGTVQQIAHKYIEGEFWSFKNGLKPIISNIIPLVLVGIITLITFAIPSAMMMMILIPIKTIAPTVLGSSSGIDLDFIWDFLEAVIFSFIFALLAIPYFLSISAIVIDGIGSTGFVKGWKLFSKNLGPTIFPMTVAWLTYLIIFLFGRFVLLGLLMTWISNEFVLVLSLISSIVVLVTFSIFIISPLVFIVMYIVYRDIKV
ncbi:MAG: hypothetical protein ACFFC7_29550 [Candidatus Hermodarchaeota archaeon]